MRRPTRIAPLALGCALLALCATPPGPATAQTREFAGRVTGIGGGHLVVESRQGETLRFVRTGRTAIEGRPDWSAIAPGDRVVVRWSLREGPHEARRVIVLGGARSGGGGDGERERGRKGKKRER